MLCIDELLKWLGADHFFDTGVIITPEDHDSNYATSTASNNMADSLPHFGLQIGGSSTNRIISLI